MAFDLSDVPSPFYRVTARAIILTPDNKLVLVEDENHEYQLPGGGWEHDESLEEGLRREVLEELSVDVKSVGDIFFTYRVRDQRGFQALRLAMRVEPASYDFHASDGMLSVKLVDKQELTTMTTICPGEGPIQDYADLIWPAS